MYQVIGNNKDTSIDVRLGDRTFDDTRKGKARSFLNNIIELSANSLMDSKFANYDYEKISRIEDAVRAVRNSCRAKKPIRYWFQRINPFSNAFKIERLSRQILNKVREFRAIDDARVKLNNDDPFKYFEAHQARPFSLETLSKPYREKPNLRFMYYCIDQKSYHRRFDQCANQESAIILPIWIDTKRSAIRLLSNEEIENNLDNNDKQSRCVIDFFEFKKNHAQNAIVEGIRNQI